MHHGLPSEIIFDRDPRFTNSFWQALFENLGTTFKFSSTYHPQIDGQTKIVNLTLLDMLKSYVNDQQISWERFLPFLKFAYNNIMHSSLGKASYDVT